MAVLAVVLGVFSTQARAVTLASLLTTGATITVGDKTFSDFTYSTTGSGMPAAINVNVTGINNALGVGLEFQGNFTAFPAPTSSDALLGYNVTVNTPGVLITDWHLSSNPSFSNNSGTGSINITDTFTGPTGTPPLFLTNTNDGTNGTNTLTVAATVPPLNVSPPGGTASGDFVTPVASLRVRKDMAITSGTATGTFSFADQIASQSAVPEPTTMVMAAFALPLLLTVARRRSKALAMTAA